MAKQVFFSFHYQDVVDFRANVVRMHWVTKPNAAEAGFFDHSLWESTKKRGSLALKQLIHSGLDGSSVTCVLTGSQTFARPWVRYEILKSFRKGNKLLVVHINSIKDKDLVTKTNGPNPLSYLGVTYSESGSTGTLWEMINGNWTKYSEIDGSASFHTGGVPEQYRGKGYNLARWYGEYDWIANDGYNNFSSWVS